MTLDVQPSDPQPQESLLIDEQELDPKIQNLHQKYLEILKQVLPYLGKDHSKIIYAQVMLALKLEGVIGKDLSKKDSHMVNVIKEAIMASDDRKEEALLVAERIMRGPPPTSK